MTLVSSHEENRGKVCACCGKKIFPGKKKIQHYKISENCAKLIKKYVNKKFDNNDSRFPNSICNTCRNTVFECDKNDAKRPSLIMPNYESIILQKDTRNKSSQSCSCYICLEARLSKISKNKQGAGNKRHFSVEINPLNGQYAASSPDTVSVYKSSTKSLSNDENIIKICQLCFKKIKGSGQNHKCVTTYDRQDNFNTLIETAPESMKEKMISHSIKRKFESTDNSGKSQNDVELLSRNSKKLKLHLHSKNKSDIIFSSQDLDEFQNHMDMSNTSMKKVTRFLRVHAGKNSVPKNYREHFSFKSKIFEKVYNCSSCDFEVENSKLKESRPVIWADAENLLNVILTERNIIGNYKVKVMADGGQGFFKVSLSVLPEDYIDGLKERDDDLQKHTSANKNSLPSSVYKTILLCIVPKIKESYENIKILFDLTKINNMSFQFVSDFKLLLLVNGQQTASSTFPCPYCFVTLADLKSGCKEFTSENKIIISTDTNSSVAGDESKKLKTYGDLNADYIKFCNTGKKNKKEAKFFRSTVNTPLLVEKSDLTVLQKCPVPELHLLQGFVNHIFWNGLVKIVGRERALLWPKKLKVIPKSYHGEIFEGNACRKLLQNADMLNDQEIYSNFGIFRLQPIISAFKAMNKVVECSFSTKKVNEAILTCNIKELNRTFDATDVSESLKIHVLLNHVEKSVEYLDYSGLGLWSEQAGESLHREFIKFWNRYKINLMDDPSYAVRLRNAVIDFSSKHI